MVVATRPASEADRDVLARMLAEAAAWRDGVDGAVQDVLAPPGIAHYLPPSWPSSGEFGLVASLDGDDVGAAWWTLLPADDPGYGFVDERIPELSIGVAPRARGRGIGTRLLDGLCRRADHTGLPGLSLSVEVDNPAVRLYDRAGFTVAGEARGALTMLRRCPAPRPIPQSQTRSRRQDVPRRETS